MTSIQEGLKKGPKKLAAPAKGKKGKDDGKGGKGSDKGEGGKAKDKGKGKGGGKGQGKKGGSKPKDSGGKNQSSDNKGACLFWPKGLCRRGSECPYRHEGPSGSTLGTSASAKASSPASASAAAKASSSTPAPATAAKVKAAVALCSVIGAAGVIEPNPQRGRGRFAIVWGIFKSRCSHVMASGIHHNYFQPFDF